MLLVDKSSVFDVTAVEYCLRCLHMEYFTLLNIRYDDSIIEPTFSDFESPIFIASLMIEDMNTTFKAFRKSKVDLDSEKSLV